MAAQAAQAAAVQAAQQNGGEQQNSTPFSFFPNMNPMMQAPTTTPAEVTELSAAQKPTITS